MNKEEPVKPLFTYLENASFLYPLSYENKSYMVNERNSYVNIANATEIKILLDRLP